MNHNQEYEQAKSSLRSMRERSSVFLENQNMAIKLAENYYKKTGDCEAIRLYADHVELNLAPNFLGMKVFYGNPDFQKNIEIEMQR